VKLSIELLREIICELHVLQFLKIKHHLACKIRNQNKTAVTLPFYNIKCWLYTMELQRNYRLQHMTMKLELLVMNVTVHWAFGKHVQDTRCGLLT
jgi:hypothetical protein